MSSIPNYHEVRLTLTEIENMIIGHVGDNSVVNIAETIKVMLGDFFYGEPTKTFYPHHTSLDRTIVWPLFGQTLFGVELQDAIENLGEVFWHLANTLIANVLTVNESYSHRPSDCFYMFYPDSRVLVVYVPVTVISGNSFGLVELDGRAVVETCRSTLPNYLRPS